MAHESQICLKSFWWPEMRSGLSVGCFSLYGFTAYFSMETSLLFFSFVFRENGGGVSGPPLNPPLCTKIKRQHNCIKITKPATEWVLTMLSLIAGLANPGNIGLITVRFQLRFTKLMTQLLCAALPTTSNWWLRGFNRSRAIDNTFTNKPGATVIDQIEETDCSYLINL